MVFTITDVQEVLILSEDVTHSLRVMELRLIVCPIDKAYFPVADLVLELHRVLIDDHESIVGRVGDN